MTSEELEFALSGKMVSLVAETTEIATHNEMIGSVRKSVGVPKILDLVAQFSDITCERLVKEVGLSVRGVEKNLAQLKSEGKIVRVGGRKGGHWEVAKRVGE